MHALGLTLSLLLVPASPVQGDGGPVGPPFRIPWQRSLADAEAVSAATGRPLLICVNLDGEPASEVFARRKYLDPEFAGLVASFVPVILSTSRHTEGDHDELGRRIPCPRFGTVTCGEHVREEPIALRRFLGGRRVAPRHVGVSSAGRILFDRFLDRDLSRVDAALREHGGAGGGGWSGLLASRDVAARAALERAYLGGDTALRAELLRAAASAGSEPYDLIRLGLREADLELRRDAWRALAATAGVGGLDLVLRTLADEDDPQAREILVPALAWLAGRDPRARRAHKLLLAAAEPSPAVPVAAWREGLAAADPPGAQAAPIREELELRLDRLLGSDEPETPGLLLALARTHLELALHQIAAGADPSLHLIDADETLARARASGADPAAAAALEARVAWRRGEPARAAEAAARALPALLADPAGAEAARALDVLALARATSIYTADVAGEDWPVEWLRDAGAAFRVLGEHPLAAAETICAHADLLGYLGWSGEAWDVLRSALRRFPASSRVHARVRDHVQRNRGQAALIPAYGELRPESTNPAAHDWFAGYAALFVASGHKARREAQAERAANDLALRSFEACAAASPAYARSARDHIARTLARQAALALGADDLDAAATSIARAFERMPEDPATPDLEHGLLTVLSDVLDALNEAQRPTAAQELLESVSKRVPDLEDRLR